MACRFAEPHPIVDVNFYGDEVVIMSLETGCSKLFFGPRKGVFTNVRIIATTFWSYACCISRHGEDSRKDILLHHRPLEEGLGTISLSNLERGTQI